MRDSQQTCGASSPKPRSNLPRRNRHRRPSGRQRRRPLAAPRISGLRPTSESDICRALALNQRAVTTSAFLKDIMHLAFRTIAVSTLTLIVSSTLAAAAGVQVLSVGSTQIAAKAIAGEFEKQTGHKVTFTIQPPFNIDKGLAEKTFDAVILSVAALEDHEEAGDLA